MKTKSCKAKGRKLQGYTRDLIYEYTGIMCKTRIMGESGDDVYLPSADSPLYIECKNREQLSIWKWLDEIRSKTTKCPVLIVKKNHKEPVVIIPLIALTALGFFDILKESEVNNEETKTAQTI